MRRILEFSEGIRLRLNTILQTVEGALSMRNTGSSNRLKIVLDGIEREIVTDTQPQTLTNKVIDATASTLTNINTTNLQTGVLDTNLASLPTPTNLQIPSALAVKTYTDAVSTALTAHITNTTGAHAATSISYSNTTSGLATTQVQGAIDILDGRMDNAESNITNTSSSLTTHIASTSAHGALGAVVGTTNSQVLSNKTLTSPILTSPSVTGTISHTNYDQIGQSVVLFNNTANQNVFNFGTYMGGEVLAYAQVSASSPLFEIFKIQVVSKLTDYVLSVESTGDKSNISFTISSIGQLMASLPSYSGFSAASLRCFITALKP